MPPVIVNAEGFEHRADVAGVPSGTPVYVQYSASGLSYVAGRLGGVALRVTDATGVTTFARQDWAPVSQRIFAGYFRLPSGAPTTDRSVILLLSDAAGVGLCRVDVRSAANGGVVEVQPGAGTRQVGPAVNDGNWHLIELLLDTSGTTWTIDWYLDGEEQDQASVAGTASTHTRVHWGSATAAHDATVDWDDFVSSDTPADYPLGDWPLNSYIGTGDYEVQLKAPTSEGTNNVGSTNPITHDGVPGSFYQKVDDWSSGAANTSDYVTYTSTTTGDAAVNYAEVIIADKDSAATEIWAVVGNAACFASGGGDDTMTVRVVDASGTQLTDIVAGDIAETTLRFYRRLVAAPVGGWTETFNDVRVRIGFSTDTAPLPRVSAVGLQIVTFFAGAQTVTVGLLDYAGAPQAPAVTYRSVLTGLLDYTGTALAPSFANADAFTNTFDAGTNGSTITTGNSGGGSGDAFNSIVINAGSTLVYDSSNELHGTLCAAINPAAGELAYMQWNPDAAVSWYARAYVKLTALPPASSNIILMDFRDAASAINRGRVSILSNGTVRIINAVGATIATTTATVTAGAYFRIECHFTGHASAGAFELKLYNTVESDTATETISGTGLNTGGTIDRFRIGQGTTAAGDIAVFYVDQIELNNHSYPGPWTADPQTVTLTERIDRSGAALDLAVVPKVTLGLLSQDGTPLEPSFSQVGAAQTVSLPTIGYGFGVQPWGSAWGGTGAQTLEPASFRRGVNLDLLSYVGTPLEPTFNARSITLPLLTVSTAGALNPAQVKFSVALDRLDYIGTPLDLVVQKTQEVSLDLLDQAGTPLAMQFNPQTVTMLQTLDYAGAPFGLSVKFVITLDRLDYIGTPLEMGNIGLGFGVATLDYTGTPLSANFIRLAGALDRIDNAGAALEPTFFISAGQTVTLDLLDNAGVAIELEEADLFDDDQTVTLDLLDYEGEAVQPVTFRPVVPLVEKRALYAPISRYRALHRPTVTNNARWSVDDE